MKIFETKSFTYFDPTLDENVKESIVIWPFSATSDIAKDSFHYLDKLCKKSYVFKSLNKQQNRRFEVGLFDM